MTESLRQQDIKAEKSLAEFMDAYFYSKLSATDGSTFRYTRIHDREQQLNGVDICIEIGDRKINIDEKASFYYSNAMIPTFAFELDSIQRGHVNPVSGWFINDDLLTDYYMLIWPNIKCEQKDGVWVRKAISSIKKNDFTIVEAMMVSKLELREFIRCLGYSKDLLIKYAKRIRSEYYGVDEQKTELLIDGLKIMYSGGIAEKPVNLVINKRILRELAKKVYLISQDGYAEIKE